MISANEAHARTMNSDNNKIIKQSKAIEKLIEEACKNGDFDIRYTEYLLDTVKANLRALGYRVERLSAAQYLYEISWESQPDYLD
jgi:hypothetical protein